MSNKHKKARVMVFAIAFTLMVTAVTVEPASALTFDNKVTAQNKINVAIMQHRPTLIIFSRTMLNANMIFRDAALSTNINGTRILGERVNFRGDYNRMALLKTFKVKSQLIRNRRIGSYYKYTFTMTYKTSKSRSDYINTKSRYVGRAYKKGTSRQRVNNICKWLARNMSYSRTYTPTIYDSYISKRGQCFHYVASFYMIAKEAGLDVRIVTGKARMNSRSKPVNHMWCIVRSGNRWYQVDPTWADTGKRISSRWIMKGKKNRRFRKTHFPDRKSTTLMNSICIVAK